MMNAIGDQREELARAISLFPNFLRSANTTFVNVRAALDDVEPLVLASIPVAEELSPFLDELRGFARGAVPTVRDLSKTVRRPGAGNDLIELQRLQPQVTELAVGSGSPDCGPNTGERDDVLVAADDDFTQGAFGESVCSLRNGEDNLEFFRAYAPELVAWFDGFSHSGYTRRARRRRSRLDDVQHLLPDADPRRPELPRSGHGDRAARRAHDRPHPALPGLG